MSELTAAQQYFTTLAKLRAARVREDKRESLVVKTLVETLGEELALLKIVIEWLACNYPSMDVRLHLFSEEEGGARVLEIHDSAWVVRYGDREAVFGLDTPQGLVAIRDTVDLPVKLAELVEPLSSMAGVDLPSPPDEHNGAIL